MNQPSPNQARMDAIRVAINAALAPESLQVTDDSHLHVGHAGARDGRGHFTVEMVSQTFDGMAPLARHRAVYAAVGDLMNTDIHALVIQAYTLAEVGR